MIDKKWDFSLPTAPPTTFRKARMAITRATNNLRYGFDGAHTPLQLGPLKEKAKPLLQVEVALTKSMLNGDMFQLIKEAAMSGRAALSDVQKAKRIADLHEDTRASTK